MRKIRLAIDTQVVHENRKTGLGVYTNNLLKFIEPECARRQIEIIQLSFRKQELNTLQRIIWSQILLPLLTIIKRADILLVPAFATPVFTLCRKITVVHDLIGLIFPENLGPFSAFFWGKFLPFSYRFNSIIYAISISTKKDILKYTKIPSKKLKIAYQGIDYSKYEKCWQRRKSKMIMSVQKKYNLYKKFFLFIGTLEPRKNLKNLIIAYHKLPAPLKKRHQLVIVGKKGWRYQNIFDLVKKLELEQNIIFLGYIEDNRLPYIYTLASFFIFPSEYEGFGLPLLEACAAGLPIAAAKNSSIPEVLLNTGDFFNCNDTDDISKTLIKLSKKKKQTSKIKQILTRQKKLFSWKKTAVTICDEIEGLAKKQPSFRNN